MGGHFRATKTLTAYDQDTQAPATVAEEAQEDILCLLGMGEAEYLDPAELLIVDQLAREGLAEWRDEAPKLTAEGCAELDRMLHD